MVGDVERGLRKGLLPAHSSISCWNVKLCVEVLKLFLLKSIGELI